MKILYITAEHVSGTLSLFQAEHRKRGDECRFVTFWHSRWNYPDDICLHLPFMPNKTWIRGIKRTLMRLRGDSPERTREEYPPYWNPGVFEKALFALRDKVNWPIIERAIKEYDLLSYDIIHLDGGADFTRNGRFVRQCAEQGKHIASFFHGSDLRNRGIIRSLEPYVNLRLTSEWDLLELDSRLQYLYLPFETGQYGKRNYRFHSPIRICHASRNVYKGTRFVVEALERLKEKHSVELILMRDLPHAKALLVKNECDIFVDQLTNEGGWGYGMSSVEALAMGLPVVTNIPDKMEKRIGQHPFIQADSNSIYTTLEQLIQQESLCREYSDKGQQWVRERHDVKSVVDRLYDYYREVGWIGKN
jgi:glycosyltransferase involved in cell wall biosynthesis